jgi:hypothetical protein
MVLHISYMNPSERLHGTAKPQGGYFTAAQASEAGYPDSLHVYHTREGHWEKVQRGIYRLRTFPIIDWPELVVWSLWSRDRAGLPQGVYAGETALRIHGVMERGPGPLTMMVPRSFRKNCELPDALNLVKGDLAENEIEVRPGYRVVTLRKALAQMNGHPDFESMLSQAREQPTFYTPSASPRTYNTIIDAGED